MRAQRIIRPERNTAGEMPYISEVKGEIAEVIRRLHLHFVAIVVDEPAKRTNRKDGEAGGEQPEPDGTIAPAWSLSRKSFPGALFAPLLAPGLGFGRRRRWFRFAHAQWNVSRYIVRQDSYEQACYD